jgi:membrane-bound serine protease (ClpP class)
VPAFAAIVATFAGITLGTTAPADEPKDASTQARAVARTLALQEAIGPASADLVARTLKDAARDGAAIVVIALDTPGGLDTSMRAIVQDLLASSVPVAVHVAPPGARAASAGTFIVQAAAIAAMAPATTLGAATPVAIGLPGLGGPGSTPPAGTDPAPSTRPPALRDKAVQDAAAFIRSLAQRHGRNADWAERAVRDAATLTAEEAVRDGVIDLLASDTAELLQRIDGRTVTVRGQPRLLATRDLVIEPVLPDWRHRALSAIANPSLALLLMMLGLYGLVLEFASPGFGVAGTAGAICLLLGLFALQMLPVRTAGLALLVLGLALMAAELVTPTVGVLGAGGVAAFVAGGLLLFERDVPGFGLPVWLIVGMALTSLAVITGAGAMAMRARRQPVVSGASSLVGMVGLVVGDDDGEHWVRVRGEHWHARCAQRLAAGQRVRITAVDGLTLHVHPDPDIPPTVRSTPHAGAPP